MAELKQGSACWWNAQIEDRVKGLRKLWLDEADKVVAKYEAEDRTTENCVFNILYSNTETLLPALYNSTPRPDVSRRYSMASPERKLDSAVGQVAERLLEYSADSCTTDYGTFDAEVRAAVLHALVPGMGQVRIRFLEEEGHQELVYDALAYDRFLWSYARKWCHVTWVAFGCDLNQEGFESQFPKFCRTADYRKWAEGGWKALKDKFDQDPTSKPRDWQTGQRLEPALVVWEIWNHEKKEIKWVCSNFEDDFLLEEPYPFNMTTRFPCPEPLGFVKRNNNLTPKPLYDLYRDQDRELQEISRRLLRVARAIRARGAYDARLAEFEQIFGQDSDNALIPIMNAGALENGGLDKAIWFVPIDMLMKVATELLAARESIKQTIYEITGVGDLIRGQAESVQTAVQAGEQSKWATLRLKRWQNDVAYFCRDLFRIGFEFMANLYSAGTIADITKLEYLHAAEKQAYQNAMGQYQLKMQQMQAQQAQMAQAAGPGAGAPPPPPPQIPPPVPPDKLAMMEFPTWEEICQVMRDKFERTYRIDVETNSTVDLEATEDKQSMAEFMNAFGQMAAGMQNMVETGMLSFDVSKAIMGELFRRYRFGRSVEQFIEQMKPPQGAGQGAAAGLQAQMQASTEKFQAQLATKDTQVGQVREMLERERAQAKNSSTEMIGKIKELEIQLTAARAEKQVGDSLHTTQLAQKDVQHATQLGGVQRNLEQERLNKAGMQNQHQQELFTKDNQIGSLQQQGMFKDQEHKMALGEKEQEIGGLKAAHDGEKRQMHLDHGVAGLKEKMAAAKAPQPAAPDHAKQALDQHLKALEGIVQRVGAPRETTIEVGPDGKKRGISKIKE